MQLLTIINISGKCYNKAENWYEDLLETRSEENTVKPDQSSSQPAPPKVLERAEEEVEEAAKELLTDVSNLPATSRAKKITLGQGVKNIPAYLPYEAKEALLRKLRAHRNHRQLGPAAADPAPPKEGSRVSHPGQTEFRANYPQAQVQPHDSHFLYGHAPITGYKLPDGSSGTVNKSPRK